MNLQHIAKHCKASKTSMTERQLEVSQARRQLEVSLQTSGHQLQLVKCSAWVPTWNEKPSSEESLKAPRSTQELSKISQRPHKVSLFV